ncbi:hypothetical protein HYY74_00405 [Candidatus Woesearchaeota archaeon]|nr:hypothetical protein [Candidatus Woesearchaeota archaeon]
MGVFLTGEQREIGLALEYLRRVNHLSGLEATCGEQISWIRGTQFQTYLDLKHVYAAMGYRYTQPLCEVLMTDTTTRGAELRRLQAMLQKPQQETASGQPQRIGISFGEAPYPLKYV